MPPQSLKFLLASIAIQLVLFAVLVFTLPYWFDPVQQPAAADELSTTDENGAPELGVKELIRTVKQELEDLDKTRFEVQGGIAEEKELPLFRVESFDLEIRFFVSQRKASDASVRPQFVVVGRESEVSAEKTQTIRLHMAVDATPRQVQAAGSTEPLQGEGTAQPVTPQPPASQGP